MLAKELQTHKRGGGRPCIPTGLSNRFHPQALSLLCCFSRRLLFCVRVSRRLFSSSFLLVHLDDDDDIVGGQRVKRGKTKAGGWIRWPRRNKRSEKGGKSRKKSRPKGTFGTPCVYAVVTTTGEYVRACRCRQLSYEAASFLGWWRYGQTSSAPPTTDLRSDATSSVNSRPSRWRWQFGGRLPPFPNDIQVRDGRAPKDRPRRRRRSNVSIIRLAFFFSDPFLPLKCNYQSQARPPATPT